MYFYVQTTPMQHNYIMRTRNIKTIFFNGHGQWQDLGSKALSPIEMTIKLVYTCEQSLYNLFDRTKKMLLWQRNLEKHAS